MVNNKKENEQKQARILRLQGMSLLNIARTLGVSKGSVSVWVRSIPTPEMFTNEYRTNRKLEKIALKKEAIKEKVDRRNYIKEHLYEHLKRVSETGEPLFQDIRVLSGDRRWMVPSPLNYMGKRYIKNIYVYEHRLIIEMHLGRLLSNEEVVHHINENKLDNRLINLKIMTVTAHVNKHRKAAQPISLICDYCGIPFEREKSKYKKDRIHKFCCLSHANSFQQMERRKRLKKSATNGEYLLAE